MSDRLHIPLEEREALRLLMKVKPTDEMPRPGTNRTTAKPRAKKAPRKRP